MVLAFAFLIGIVAGLRAVTAPAAIAWAAWLGRLDLSGSWLAFLGHGAAVAVLTLLALAEFVADQLPSTPSRKVPHQFGARLVTGAVAGAAIGTAGGSMLAGLAAGLVGAVAGTFGGAEARRRLALAFGRDLPAALIEDAIAVLLALLVVVVL